MSTDSPASWPLLPSSLALDHGASAHEVKEIIRHVSLATSSRCSHARLTPDTRPLLIPQKPAPSIVVDWESLLVFIMVLFRNPGHGVLFPERFQDHKDLGLSRIPNTEASLDSLGLILR